MVKNSVKRLLVLGHNRLGIETNETVATKEIVYMWYVFLLSLQHKSCLPEMPGGGGEGDGREKAHLQIPYPDLFHLAE